MVTYQIILQLTPAVDLETLLETGLLPDLGGGGSYFEFWKCRMAAALGLKCGRIYLNVLITQFTVGAPLITPALYTPTFHQLDET